MRFLTSYANAEAEREALPVRFVSVLPELTPTTGLGSRAVAAYAERQGVDVATFLARRGPALTPEQVGAAVVDLAGRRDPSVGGGSGRRSRGCGRPTANAA